MNDKQTNGGDTNFASVFVCSVCHQRMRNPHMLPCLHAFCLACLQNECSQRSRDKFFCPVCVDSSELLPKEISSYGNSNNTDVSASKESVGKKSVSSHPWHSFDTIVENEAVHDALQRKLAELPASERAGANDKDERDDDDDEDSDGYYGDDGGGSGQVKESLTGLLSARLKAPAMFPCSNHPEKLTDQFCNKCEQISCPKCITSFHRRCSQSSIVPIQKAVESKRRGFDSLHNTIAGNLALCEDAQTTQASRAALVETTRSKLLQSIRTVREKMVAAILAKEKELNEEVNRMMDLAQSDAEEKAKMAEKLAVSLGRQLDVMNFSIGAGVEGELLPYLPGLETSVKADVSLATGTLQEAQQSEILFQPDEVIEKAIESSPLGCLKVKRNEEIEMVHGASDKGNGKRLGLTLTLVTSFHGGARDDMSEPLLTDLVLLTNGDVILTDRDNHCVKKFNRTGKLLTRVMLDASPSRIAIVSQGRAVVCTTSRRELYFLSLQGTVRVLSSVRVKKLYTFLTSLGGGMLAAGTNYGDSLDLITEDGGFVRTIFSSKPERAGISRPFYITPVQPLDQQQVQSALLTPLNDSQTSNDERAGGFKADHVHSPIKPETSSASTNSDKTVKSKGNTKENTNSSSRKSSIGTNNNSTNVRRSSIANNSTLNKSKQVSNAKGKTSPTSTSTSSNSQSSSISPFSDSIPPAAASTSSYSTDDLWVTDSARKILFRLRQTDGKTTYTLKSRPDLHLTLECPLGVTVHPSGLPLLADRDTDSVLLLDEGGNYVKPVLTSADGLSKPCAIYADYKGQIALSQVDGMVKIYSSQRHYF